MKRVKFILYCLFYVCLIAYLISPKIEKRPSIAISMIVIAALIVTTTLRERRRKKRI